MKSPTPGARRLRRASRPTRSTPKPRQRPAIPKPRAEFGTKSTKRR